MKDDCDCIGCKTRRGLGTGIKLMMYVSGVGLVSFVAGMIALSFDAPDVGSKLVQTGSIFSLMGALIGVPVGMILFLLIPRGRKRGKEKDD